MLTIVSLFLTSTTSLASSACEEFYYIYENAHSMAPAEFGNLNPNQQRKITEFTDKGYEFKIRKYRTKNPPIKVLDYFEVTKFPQGSLIDRLAKSIEQVTGSKIVFDFMNHQPSNRGSIDFYENLIFLSPQNLSVVDGLPTPTFLHELHHIMNRYLSFFRRDVNLSNALFVSSPSTAMQFQKSIRSYAKSFFLDELSAARLTDGWRKKSADPDSNLHGADESSYEEPATDLRPLSAVVLNALAEKRFSIETTFVDVDHIPKLQHHGQPHSVMPMTKTVLTLYDQDGENLGTLYLELPRLVAKQMQTMSAEKQAKKKWSKNQVEKEIDVFAHVLERQLNLKE